MNALDYLRTFAHIIKSDVPTKLPRFPVQFSRLIQFELLDYELSGIKQKNLIYCNIKRMSWNNFGAKKFHEKTFVNYQDFV